MRKAVIDSPVGALLLKSDGEYVTEVSFTDEAAFQDDCALLKKCKEELDAYFSKILREFTVPVKLVGTDFRKKCWEALRAIPYGETISYKQLAAKIGSPKACRAVGGANHHNPVVVIVPCHRVIGADGGLTGFGGGLDKKRVLLELEKRHKNGFLGVHRNDHVG